MIYLDNVLEDVGQGGQLEFGTVPSKEGGGPVVFLLLGIGFDGIVRAGGSRRVGQFNFAFPHSVHANHDWCQMANHF